jgi:DNA-directed RNA polymerase specialized sigma24 family protein
LRASRTAQVHALLDSIEQMGLTDEMQSAIVNHAEGKSHGEIAKEERIKPGSSRQRLWRARRRIIAATQSISPCVS